MKIENQKNPSNQRLGEIRTVFLSDYRAYQYCFVEFFIEHLTDISRVFRGDLQAMIILALVGQVQMRAMRSAAQAGIDPHGLPPERLSINASRVADVSGIPRETVRRKLDWLVERGWLVRNEDSSFRLLVDRGEAPARRDLSDLDKRAVERVARLFRDLENILSSHSRNSGSQHEPAQNGHASSPGE